MSFLTVFTLVLIAYQTLTCVVISWLTLNCKLNPDSDEPRELTLVKLLYLYDPVACERIHLYNYTIYVKHKPLTSIVWPISNVHAANFRAKCQLSLTIHILWMVFYVAHLIQRRRPCGFYATLVPFTLTGLANLIVSVVFTGMFLADVPRTGSEHEILEYIDEDMSSLRWSSQSPERYQILDPQSLDDTSWIALLLAYASCGGVVLWVFNFWIVKDNYFRGLEEYRRLQKERDREGESIRLRRRSDVSRPSQDQV